jgi:hypothetical protein
MVLVDVIYYIGDSAKPDRSSRSCRLSGILKHSSPIQLYSQPFLQCLYNGTDDGNDGYFTLSSLVGIDYFTARMVFFNDSFMRMDIIVSSGYIRFDFDVYLDRGQEPTVTSVC